MATKRQQERRKRALVRFPKTWISRKGMRSEEAWHLERSALERQVLLDTRSQVS